MKSGIKKATHLTVLLMLTSFLFTSGFSFVTLSRDLKTENIKNADNVKNASKLPFYDIEGMPSEGAIMEMYARNVIKGDNNGSYHPKQPVTNLEAIVVIDRLLGFKPTEEDITSNIYLQETFNIPRWAVGYIALALDNNLLLYEDLPKMSIQEPLIRQDAAVFAVRAVGLTKEAKKRKSVALSFNDIADLNAELKGYIAVADEKGILKGVANNSFQPKGPVSRGEMAVILSNISAIEQPQADNQLTGFVTAVDAQKNALALSDVSDKSINLVLPENYVCYLDFKPTTLESIKKGDLISVISKEGGLTVVMAKSKDSFDGLRVEFEPVNPGQAPEEIQQWVEANKNSEKYLSKKDGDSLYILVCRGEKKTAGYRVDILKIFGSKDDVEKMDYTVAMEFTDPEPDAFVSQVIDYPYVLVRIDNINEPLNALYFVNEHNQKVAEIINKK